MKKSVFVLSVLAACTLHLSAGEYKPEQWNLDARMRGFYPSRFNAREWVRVFKDAGAKYVTIRRPKDYAFNYVVKLTAK